ncbi:hypothetical protein C8E03_10571 [Lachnotalea glycerini]|uniref:Uncharacterized protein n=1 Tax=Lachnotalea glycerini TaxID=1763509 RepID=A0A318ES31_9FIRM|nr:hypothetical protein [Lachnotalea glycerini]PXV90164.1 hypothetical protein C8E03_10571 [Lachnotalea glycerini]
MKDRIIGLLESYGKLIVISGIVIAALGLAVSYVFPNTVINTTDINVIEGSEFSIPLPPNSFVEYQCNSGTKPLNGIQVWISKQGAEFTDGKVIYEVYDSNGTLLGTGEQLLKDVDDPQYVYLPFTNMSECNGVLTIKFYFTGSENAYPALIANKEVEIKDEYASTSVNGKRIEGNLKSSYIYFYHTYPLVFDLKVMLAIFVSVFFTLESKKKQKVIKHYE